MHPHSPLITRNGSGSRSATTYPQRVLKAIGNHSKLCITANCVPVNYNTTNSEGTTLMGLAYTMSQLMPLKRKKGQKKYYYKQFNEGETKVKQNSSWQWPINSKKGELVIKQVAFQLSCLVKITYLNKKVYRLNQAYQWASTTLEANYKRRIQVCTTSQAPHVSAFNIPSFTSWCRHQFYQARGRERLRQIGAHMITRERQRQQWGHRCLKCPQTNQEGVGQRSWPEHQGVFKSQQPN